MEAVVALGLASNAVQFVDFASKIISGSIKIYHNKRDGDLDREGSSLENITKDLEGYNKNLVKALAGQSTPRTASLSRADEDIVRMCTDCQKIIAKLLDLLNKLKNTKTTAWSSLMIALKTVWNESEIKALEQTLNSYRQQLALYLLASVRDEIRTFKDEQIQRELASAQKQKRDTKEDLSSVEQTRHTVVKFFERIQAPEGWQESVLDAMRADYDTQHSKYLRSSPATGMVSQMRKGDLEKFDKGLLQWIRFSEVDDRYTKVTEAYHKTFEWIFHSPPNNAWSDFTTWLYSESEPLYWITGKPAAGKSTLMKFLHSDPRTLRLLSQWSNEKKLIYCPFYFWNSGTKLQMSQEGMARTLLYKSLEQAPELWSILFPQQMEVYIGYGNPWLRPITWKMLEDAFQKLVEAAGPKYRLFFFIDGLDEFDGDHARLIALIQGFLSPHVKTCVSSRPWNVFQDNFRRRPSLRLEDLTYGDIKHYVKSRFEDHAGFQDRQRETPNEALELIENITIKASGVWLWVALVTDSLLEGLSDGDRLSELQARLDALPADLETLFWRILTSLGDHHRERASQILQIIQASITPLNVLTLSYADEEDPDFALKIPFEIIPAGQMEARARNICRRLNASCRGLLEWKAYKGRPLAYATVGYLHRTVKDYIEQPDVWFKLLDHTDEDFDPYTRLCSALISVLKTDPRYRSDGVYIWDLATYAIEYAVRADPEGELGSQVEYLKEIDITATALANESPYELPEASMIHWSDSREGSFLTASFLGVAVQLRLESYIRATIHSVRDKLFLNHALQIAVEKDPYADPVPNIHNCPMLLKLSRSPSLEIIDLLLRRGADPNAKLKQTFTFDLRSPWERFLRDFSNRHDKERSMKIGKMLLDHGALLSLITKDFDEELYDWAKQVKRQNRMKGITTLGTKIKSKLKGKKSLTPKQND